MSAGVLLDRVSGAQVDDPESPFISGRYLCRAGSETYDVALADPRGRWSIPGVGEHREGSLEADRVLSNVVLLALGSLAEQVLEAEPAAIAQVSPLLPRDMSIELSDTDRLIRDSSPTIEDAVARPHARLGTVREVVPTGRARRIDFRTPAYLAAHSEHWGRQSIAGVQPTHVLSIRTDTDLRIYENELLVEAVESAFHHVWTRQHEARQLQGFVGALETMMDRLTEASSWRHLEGVFEVIGEAYDLWTTRRNTVDGTELALSRLKRKLGAMRSELEPMGIRRLGKRPLQSTNLLRDDHRYRAAHQVLLALRRLVDTAHLDSRDGAAPPVLQWYCAYVEAVVLRGFAEVGIHVVAGSSGPGGILELSDGTSVTWDDGDRLLISRGGELVLRVVPLPHPLDEQDVASLVGSDGGPPVLVAHLGGVEAGHEEPSSLLDRLPHEQRLENRPGVMSITPLDPNGPLRMARLARWMTLGASLHTYARAVECRSQTLEAVAAHSWVEVLDHGSFAVARRPSSAELQALVASLPTRAGGHRQMREVLDDPDELRQTIEQRTRDLERLSTCPVCRTPAARLEPRSGRTFWCSCDACESEWGLRSCDRGHRVPVLVPGGSADVEASAGMLERYGSYSLSLRCPASNEDAVFVCPECKRCPSEQECGKTCEWCSHG